MMRAVMRGHAAEALRWRRVRLMLLEEEAELERLMAQDEAVWRMTRGARPAGSVD
jgi:hypothetical protein